MNFCVAILILKMEESAQYFWHTMLYYFKKGKTTTEVQQQQKRFVQRVEKVLRLIRCVKKQFLALAGVAQWIECRPANQRVAQFN